MHKLHASLLRIHPKQKMNYIVSALLDLLKRKQIGLAIKPLNLPLRGPFAGVDQTRK